MDAAVDLQTWQEAFEKYPVATTRAIERQLRASAANNRDKLRVLVGGNYRELLSTAEQILALEGQTKSAETHLSEIGQQCHPPSYQKQTDPSAPRRRQLCQVRLLQRCVLVIKSATEKYELLQSAQLIVVARLLLKSLADDQASPKPMETYRERVGSLRRQLIRRMDLVLASPRSTMAAMVQTSCSYCLVTSSSFHDVVRHIGRLRLERLRKLLEGDESSDQQILRGLQYYVASLRVIGDLTGRAMMDALSSLQKRPILQEPAIVDLELLDLKSLHSLIPDEIQTFIPYFKRTPFESDEVREALAHWSSNASPILAKGLERLVLEKEDMTSVLNLRKELFSILLPVYFSLPGSSAIYKALRGVLINRIEALCDQHVGGLDKYSSSISEPSISSAHIPGLWDEELTKMALDRGAEVFLHYVHRRRCGLTAQLARDSQTLAAWISSTKAILTTFEGLTDTKWQDLIEEPDDEQQDEANNIIKAVGKDESERFLSQMRTSLTTGFRHFEDNLAELISRNTNEHAGAQQAVYQLRFIREMVLPLRQAFPSEAKFQKTDQLIPRLHQVIAAAIVSQACSPPDNGSDGGSPSTQQPIENMPSPRTFDFLRRLSLVMSSTGGTDIWSGAAVKAVKVAVADTALDASNQQNYVQSNFDEEYLHAALDVRPKTEDDLKGQVKAARDYWNRTKVLFGVLSA